MKDKLLEEIMNFVLNNMGNREFMHLQSYFDNMTKRYIENQELKDVILEMAMIVDEYHNYFNMGDNIHNLYIEYSKLIERLKQERGE